MFSKPILDTSFTVPLDLPIKFTVKTHMFLMPAPISSLMFSNSSMKVRTNLLTL